ncbi:MAG: hypothetical protein QT11_C0001G0122 [archaeon GW2011_AR20]|nr:MAG: hypothetical protein QT11_C0001G0122 [archaeon GW2011_AR20]MBS3160702.1 hypothetical protein [Candidatus Woesearchaeota archaeon]
MKPRFRILCKKCKNFYLPDKSKLSKLGYCENCRLVKGRCKVITELGYQCQNESQFFGYCISHFLTRSIKDLIKDAKK